MYSNKINTSNNNHSSHKRNKRFKIHHEPQRPSLPSIHQIFPSPPLLQAPLPQPLPLSQLSSSSFINFHSSLPFFSNINNEIYHYEQNLDEQILEGASLFFFGNNSQSTSSSSPTPFPRNKRKDFVLFDPRDSPPPSNFKGKLVPDLGGY